MHNATHIARLLTACSISTEQFLSFVRQSKHLTPRQRLRLRIVGGAA